MGFSSHIPRIIQITMTLFLIEVPPTASLMFKFVIILNHLLFKEAISQPSWGENFMKRSSPLTDKTAQFAVQLNLFAG